MRMTITRLLSLLVLATTVFVTGCATKFERQAFNSEASTHIKKITVSQWNEQEDVPTFIINHPAAGFGLIGAAIVISDRNTKTKKVTEALDPAKTKLTTAFYNQALPGLKSIGYETISIPAKRGDKADTVREATLKDQGQDATLMLGIDAAYVAAGATSDYYPAVVLGAELTDTKTKAVLYRESYHYGYNNGVKEVSHIDAASQCKFKDMDTLTANIEVTRNCLMAGVDVLVKQLIADLKK